MLSKNDLTLELKKMKFNDAEISTVLSDVAQIILARTLNYYISELPAEEQEEIKKLSPEQISAYFETNIARLPKLSQADFEKIHDDTWKEYFAEISKK